MIKANIMFGLSKLYDILEVFVISVVMEANLICKGSKLNNNGN